ncbi:MAG TPA: T9SS type A sorting domain-containing protein [Bacteroidia bacterium]|nr:T9SS type A sorting domain-containing protein [Bacteroidia bacterium]
MKPQINSILYLSRILLFNSLFLLGQKVDAATITCITSGYWDDGSTWSSNSTPAEGDIINIPAGFTVIIRNQVTFAVNSAPITLNINGSLVFVTGKKLSLDCNSVVAVMTGGTVVPGGGGGNSNYIDICGFLVWSAGNGTASGPITWSIGPLPVGWLGMDVVNKPDHSALVKWATASEVNNNFFTIERSRDGIIFESIGQVSGHGTTSQFSQYAFTDHNPITGSSYYRIRQTDYDGRTSLSEITFFTLDPDLLSRILVYPNPSAGPVYVKNNGSQKVNQWNIRVCNTLGKVVLDKQFDTPLTNQQAEIEMQDNLPNGAYMVIIYTSSEIHSTRLILQRR